MIGGWQLSGSRYDQLPQWQTNFLKGRAKEDQGREDIHVHQRTPYAYPSMQCDIANAFHPTQPPVGGMNKGLCVYVHVSVCVGLARAQLCGFSMLLRARICIALNVSQI